VSGVSTTQEWWTTIATPCSCLALPAATIAMGFAQRCSGPSLAARLGAWPRDHRRRRPMARDIAPPNAFEALSVHSPFSAGGLPFAARAATGSSSNPALRPAAQRPSGGPRRRRARPPKLAAEPRARSGDLDLLTHGQPLPFYRGGCRGDPPATAGQDSERDRRRPRAADRDPSTSPPPCPALEQLRTRLSR